MQQENIAVFQSVFFFFKTKILFNFKQVIKQFIHKNINYKQCKILSFPQLFLVNST